jgi:hypothetical protein
MYVGKAEDQTLRQRFSQYFRHKTDTSRWPHISKMLLLWENHLWFYFAHVADDTKIDNTEQALLNSYVPPYNRRYRGVVKRQVAHMFWDALKKHIEPIREVLASNPSLNLASKHRRDDGGNILFRTVGLAAFARATRILMDDGKTMEQSVATLASNTPLELDNTVWREVLWRPETRTMLHKYVRLAQNIMLYKVDAYSGIKDSLLDEYRRITGRDYPE